MRTKIMSPADEPKEKDPMDDVEVQGHMRTLLDAHKLINDPEKMEKVHALVGRHSKAITSLKDVTSIYQKKFGGKKSGL
jgi:hypothetical protein